MTEVVLAHGVGGRSDLPIPVWLAMYAAGFVLVVTFFGLATLWRTPKLRGIEAGRTVPGLAQRIIDAPAVRRALRGIGVALLAITLAVAAFGPDDPSRNPAPTWFFVWLWVGVPFASMLIGPFYRALNPLRAISAGLTAVLGKRLTIAAARPHAQQAVAAHSSAVLSPAQPDAPQPRYPERWGYWPAVVSILVFVWLELVYRDASKPHTVLLFIVVYAVLQVAGGVRYGQEWFARADGFEVYSDLVGRLSPLGRRADRRLVWRNPLDGLASVRPRPGLVAVVCTLLGSTAFDGLTRTTAWYALTERASEQPANAVLGTVGLLASIGLVTVIYLGAARASTVIGHTESGLKPAAVFVHSLIPIMLGYAIAHYFSFFVFQGQAGYILASDPFGRGWNLFGTTTWQIDYLVISPTTIGLVQVGAIVLGHVTGVVAAHDRAVGYFAKRDAVHAQYALLGAMVLFTFAGIGLLVGSG
ncbi:hypothetical protein NWT09_27885 [Mycolicibacterium sp. jd]|uniref:Fenitrothion hydrolase n=2 Tax=Mycobacteriaceae TaxID=1762 RepID=A0A1Y0CHD6_9MYCO|nr:MULTISPECIES: hypothetical protein [Mycobacteriaceae]ART74454.1 hypothetical protein BTO20_38240 [Mycobacterium dioxanotrophicus]MDN4517314.1 hypothetical protein [Mycolicibacterium austroafricanum]UJL30649.1 hypothetical protein HZU38_09640 [Mycolicibacterium vanbaalenii]WND56245.1 hypothetical protein QQA43_26715 [Mycolicibacterium vanbaalenii]